MMWGPVHSGIQKPLQKIIRNTWRVLISSMMINEKNFFKFNAWKVISQWVYLVSLVSSGWLGGGGEHVHYLYGIQNPHLNSLLTATVTLLPQSVMLLPRSEQNFLKGYHPFAGSWLVGGSSLIGPGWSHFHCCSRPSWSGTGMGLTAKVTRGFVRRMLHLPKALLFCACAHYSNEGQSQQPMTFLY